jgi:Rod binding domain-containing protein
MDAINLIPDSPLVPVQPLKPATRVSAQDQPEDVKAAGADPIEQEKRVRLAKDFESVLMTRMLDEMKNTIGDWDEEDDAASQQMQGVFWMQLSQHVGGNGGIGLWKEILQFMNQSDPSTQVDPSLDNRL